MEVILRFRRRASSLSWRQNTVGISLGIGRFPPSLIDRDSVLIGSNGLSSSQNVGGQVVSPDFVLIFAVRLAESAVVPERLDPQGQRTCLIPSVEYRRYSSGLPGSIPLSMGGTIIWTSVLILRRDSQSRLSVLSDWARRVSERASFLASNTAGIPAVPC